MIVKEVKVFVTDSGSEPFLIWLNSLEKAIRKRIWERLDRLEYGAKGISKNLGEGLYEQKFYFGPGYRVYFTLWVGDIILLCGGDKSSQRKDIARARKFIRELKRGDL